MVYLDPVIVIQQQVFRFDVSVDDMFGVYCSGGEGGGGGGGGGSVMQVV